MSKILELRTKRNTLWEQTKDFLEKNRGDNGLVKAEAVEQYNKMAQEVKDLGAEIERLEQQAQIEAQLSAPTSNPVHADPKNGSKKDVKPTATAEYAENFWNMIRNRGHYGEVRNALSVGEDTEGGFTVPDEFEKKLVEALEENNIFRSMATVIRTSSGTRKIPIAEDTGEASWIDEGEEIPESDATFGQTMLSAYKLGTMIKISNELLNDSAFDLATYIARRFGVRMGNAEERAFITGDGVGNAHRVAVLEEGMTYKPISLPPEDSQFLETKQFSVTEICRIFRVPPHLVADLSRATFSNIEYQSLNFVMHSLTPWIVRIEQGIIKDLLLEEEQDTYFPKFNVDGLLRGDYQSRMNGYATGISNGFLSPNDIHRLENMDLIPADQGGDDYYLNGGYVKLKDAGLAQQNKATAAQQNQPQQTQPEEETPDSENRQSESTPKRQKERRAR